MFHVKTIVAKLYIKIQTECTNTKGSVTITFDARMSILNSEKLIDKIANPLSAMIKA